jgi:lipoprotein-releasing system permease protein
MSAFIFIARRYLHRANKKKVIHLMGIVAYISIAISTTSLLLSNGIYNGLESLMIDVLKSIDSDIKITLTRGKNFDSNIELLDKIQKIDGVKDLREVIETNVMLLNDHNSTIACLRGVRNYKNCKIDKLQKYLIIGKSAKWEKNTAIIGAGIAYKLDINYQGQSIEIRHINRINKKLFKILSKPYNSKKLTIGGIFSIDKQNDDKFIITPLEFAQSLTNAYGKISSIEINVAPNDRRIVSIQNDIRSIIPDGLFQIETFDEQQATLLQAIKIEKMCTRIIFIVFMFIAALNIFFALAILTITKRKDIYTLYTLGATSSTIARIFISTGLLISIRGATIGSILAYTLAWIQQKYGVVSLGASISTADAYPVDMHLNDFCYTTISVLSITFVASWIPARWSKRLLHKNTEID